MRDPERITPLLELMRKLWIKYPDLRFGQLVIYLHSLGPDLPDLFFLEDNVMLERIEEAIKISEDAGY